MNWQVYPWGQEKLQFLLDRVEAKKDRLTNLRPIPRIALEKLRKSLMLEWTYHSNAIEGSTITLQETKIIVSDGLTVGGKSLREHFETLNHHEAIQFLETLVNSNNKIKTKDLLHVHALILRNIEKDFGGRYRNSGVRITGANFTPPNALKVDGFMDELMAWVNDEKSLPLIVRAAIFHHRMVWIHPFFDGNGSTVRLIANLILMRAGYPPAIILQQDRKKYYESLNQANKGNYEKLVLLILQAAERSLDIYLSHVENKHDGYQPISTIVEEISLPYGQEYLSLLIRQGKIAGYKEGRNWLTTAEAVEEYHEKRKRKR